MTLEDDGRVTECLCCYFLKPYKTKASTEKGIEAVKTNASAATVVGPYRTVGAALIPYPLIQDVWLRGHNFCNLG